MTNISGVFKLEIDGTERDLKCTFGVIERLEAHVLKKPIILALNEALNGNVYITDIVNTILEGLKANGDTRFTRDQIGDDVMKNGIASYVEFYISFLTYAVSGDKGLSLEESTEDIKKK